jgi:O-antigen/teichoic acid export membrane protein
MDLFSRFKKDYLNYLISIIIPVIITAVSIPLFKLILGASGYGNFSITFNSVLLCTATLSGWISQSVIRYFPTSTKKKSFAKQSIVLCGTTQLIFLLPVLTTVWYFKSDFLLAVFFCLALFITSLQFSLLAISQSVFLSKKNIYSELIRTVSYIVCALVLLKFTTINYMYALFTAIIISYLLSFIYLYTQIQKYFEQSLQVENGTEYLNDLFRRFITYGGPLSLWFVFAYSISLIDKIFMLKTVGAEVQGNYQAMFDFLSRSITVIISPVIISLFPLLTAAYQNKKTGEIKKLLGTILGFELGGMILAFFLYWWFGADILFGLIKTPPTAEYKLMGLIIIAATFIWQMAIVVQKRYELKFQSNYLLGMVVLAFMSQFLLYVFFNKTNNQLLYPSGFLLSSVVYFLLVSFNQARMFFKQST